MHRGQSLPCFLVSSYNDRTLDLDWAALRPVLFLRFLCIARLPVCKKLAIVSPEENDAALLEEVKRMHVEASEKSLL